MLQEDLVHQMYLRIDRHRLNEIQAAHLHSAWDKFFDVEAYCHYAAGHALRFAEFLPRGASCLDVGCGFGYVALALECLGHPCTAWDTPHQLLVDVGRALPVSQRCYEHIQREGPWPHLAPPYQLIFLHGLWPMRDAAGWWDWPSYARLARRLLGGLAPGGTLEIICNNGEQVPLMCEPGQWERLLERGYVVDIARNVITVHKDATVCAGC
jgi:hypothetical protein